MIDTLRQTINSQNATIALLQKSMDRLHSAYDKAVKERDDLNGRMNRSNQETFGSKSLKQSDSGKVVKNDCQKKRDEWSSKDDNDNNASSASSSADGVIDQTKVKSENLSRSGRNGMKSALKYHTFIETCKNVGLNVKEYFIYVFSRLIEGEKDYEKLLPSAVAR